MFKPASSAAVLVLASVFASGAASSVFEPKTQAFLGALTKFGAASIYTVSHE